MFNCCFPETPAEDVRQQPWLDSLRTGDRFGVAYGIYRWGIDVNQKIVSRGTGLAQYPISVVCRYSYNDTRWTQIVSQLLKAKADVTQEDNFGVLHFVCSKHVPNSDIVKLLVTAKANLYFQSPPSNHTVFHVLAGYSTPYHINIAGYLLSQTSPWELWKEDSQVHNFFIGFCL